MPGMRCSQTREYLHRGRVLIDLCVTHDTPVRMETSNAQVTSPLLEFRTSCVCILNQNLKAAQTTLCFRAHLVT